MAKDEREKHQTMSAQELARERTSLAAERTALANQRTFSAWLRTGLSSVLAGLAIVKFIGTNEYFKAYVVLIGIVFVAIGIGIYILAYVTYLKTIEDEIDDKTIKPTVFNILTIITLGMIVSAILIIVLLIFYEETI